MGEGGRGPFRKVFSGLRRTRASVDGPAPVDQDATRSGDRLAGVPDHDLLLASPLFDVEWYALVTGASGDRESLVRHHLARPVGERVSPQPLFDPSWFRRHYAGDVGDRDPFLVYLRRQAWATATHPLFSASYYRRTVPAAKKHPHGPIGHYLETGAASGAPVHRWLRGDGSTPAPDVRELVVASRRDWIQRQAHAESGKTSGTRTPDWQVEATRDRDRGLTSVLVSTRADWESTARAVRRVIEGEGGSRVQVVVLSRGSDPLTTVMLSALAVRHPGVEVLHHTDPGLVSSTADAMSRLQGSTLLLLDPGVDLDPEWLDPMLLALADPEVLGCQPLLLTPERTIRNAGLAFADGGRLHEFLHGFPVEDAAGIDRLSFQALGGACLLLRTSDFAAVGGWDDAAAPAAQGIDLCRRLAEVRTGRFSVVPGATALQHGEAHLPDHVRTGAGQPSSDQVALWGSRGFRLLEADDRVSEAPAAGPATTAPANVGAVGGPTVQRVRHQVSEGEPRLRWAIKNPATTGPYGDRWGDTHFAAALASALRALGQDVVTDRRDAFHRPTGQHDDVNLVLRGLTPFMAPPHTGTVTLGWVISHPDEVTADEARTWDRALAASTHWAAQKSQEWGIDVAPLLQATDPSRFHPDLAEPDTGHPLLFVGNSRKQYRPMVRAAVEQGLPLSVYGTEWEGLLPPEFLTATYLPNEQLGAAYGAAGVVLNDHWEDMRVDGFVSNRLFDAVASGARVITDDVSGLGDLFGRSVQVARTPGELVTLASAPDLDAHFGGAAERRDAAERVRTEHSFGARARRLLDVAVAARAAAGLPR